MKAVYITDFASPGSLELLDVADPPLPKSGQVVVRVKAAGLNRADLLQRGGKYPPPLGISPNIPGLEFAGEIVRVSSTTANWKVNDRVFGITAGEAQAEYLTVDEPHLAPMPDNLTFVEAAAIPEAFITAHDAVFTRGQLQSGQTLLVHAIGSGVGLAALQLAKAADAKVIGTSRTADKIFRCAQFGLDVGIMTGDGSEFQPGVAQSTDGRGANVILDLVGASYFDQNLRSLASEGRMLLVGLTSGRTANFDLALALQKRATIIGTVLRARSSEEKAMLTKKFTQQIVPLLQSGKIIPNVDRVYAAYDVVEAYDYLASNASFGKVVLEF